MSAEERPSGGCGGVDAGQRLGHRRSVPGTATERTLQLIGEALDLAHHGLLRLPSLDWLPTGSLAQAPRVSRPSPDRCQPIRREVRAGPLPSLAGAPGGWTCTPAFPPLPGTLAAPANPSSFVFVVVGTTAPARAAIRCRRTLSTLVQAVDEWRVP